MAASAEEVKAADGQIEEIDADQVAAELDRSLPHDDRGNVVYPYGFVSFVLETGKRYRPGVNPEHDLILEFLDNVEPIIVDRKTANKWIEGQAKAAGVNAIKGKWAMVKNAGRQILELAGKLFLMELFLRAVENKMPIFILYKKEPRPEGGFKCWVEIRPGVPWEKASVMDPQKADAFLKLIRYYKFNVASVWANPKVRTDESGKGQVVYHLNIVVRSEPERDLIADFQREVRFEITDGSMAIRTPYEPSKFANNPGHHKN